MKNDVHRQLRLDGSYVERNVEAVAIGYVDGRDAALMVKACLLRSATCCTSIFARKFPASQDVLDTVVSAETFLA